MPDHRHKRQTGQKILRKRVVGLGVVMPGAATGFVVVENDAGTEQGREGRASGSIHRGGVVAVVSGLLALAGPPVQAAQHTDRLASGAGQVGGTLRFCCRH